MDDYERAALKAACIQAAAILLAPHPRVQPQPTTPPFGGRGAGVTPTASPASEPDTAACARYARDLYGKLTGEIWEEITR